MQNLTASAIKSAKPKAKPYKLSDGGGLYLLTKPQGKYWRYDYRFASRRKTLAVGVYPDVSLAEARKRHQEAREKLAKGIDPSTAKKVEKLTASLGSDSFEAVAREWLKKRGKKSEGGDKRLYRLIEKDLIPYIGKRDVGDIIAPELLAVLQKIEDRGAIDTAHRAKQAAGMVFRFAIASGRAKYDPSAGLKEALAQPKKTHFKSLMKPEEIGKLMLAIDEYKGTPVVMSALKLSPLLFCRPGELRQLEWNEVDLDESRIELPSQKMKAGEPHIIPLSFQAKSILTELLPLTGQGKYVFPSARGASRCLSENGVRTALRSLGYTNEQISPHGFRSMARTILDEKLGFRVDWIEHQLAHTVKDPNGRAYNRTAHLEGRSKMMQEWANYLEGLKSTAASSTSHGL